MKNRKRGGFTLAEVLAVIAILLILFGLIAVNVAARQRSMTRLEFDSIAKEIFIAAQNHLTAAESQGYLGLDEADFGVKVTEEKTDESGKTYKQVSYYYDSTNSPKIREQMLPDYAVVYAGDFVIHYQAHPARVLDVYYSDPQKSSLLTIAGKNITVGDINVLEQHRGFESNQVAKREKYPNGAGKWVIGWYGGDGAQTQGVQLEVPTFEIHNEEQLYVKVFDPNVGKKSLDGLNDLSYNLKLVVKGKSSGAEKYFTLSSTGGTDIGLGRCVETDGKKEFSVLLDDVVDGLHFAQIPMTARDKGTFSPGEDLEIFVVAYSSTELTNIAKSGSQDTNSLFADPAPASAGTPASTEVKYSDVNSGLAAVANFRHLENLDKKVSGLTKSISEAAQTSDVDWTASWTDWKGNTATWEHIRLNDTDGTATGANCYYPVSPDYKLSYDGQNHVIKNVKVDYSGSSGLFGSMTVAGSKVENLELVDFSVTAASGDAGALIGKADGVAVTNVLARNNQNDDGTREISGATAGGLIGSMDGGRVQYSAAAVYVKATGTTGGLVGNAGGLIGNVMNAATVEYSYSGGHTEQGTYLDTQTGPARINVFSASGNAGGLIGYMPSGTVNCCYSTCSAEGASAAGGLIGSASGTVKSSYATGLVKSDTAASAHALIGSGSVEGTGNKYLWIINQDQDWQKDIVDHSADPAADIPGGITATDADKATTTFVSFFNGSGPAQPYDAKLLASYEGKYPMHPVSTDTAKYVSTHYGDWPMPETLVVNP